MRVLSPAGFALDHEAQSPVHLDVFDSDGAMTAAFVHPATSTASITFLSALVPTRTSTWDARTKVEPIDAAAPDVGAIVTGGVIGGGAGVAGSPVLPANLVDDGSSSSSGGCSVGRGATDARWPLLALLGLASLVRRRRLRSVPAPLAGSARPVKERGR